MKLKKQLQALVKNIVFQNLFRILLILLVHSEFQIFRNCMSVLLEKEILTKFFM